LFEAITTIHFPGFEQLKKDLPLLGSIRLVQANYSQYSSRYDLLMAGQLTNIFDPAFSGGALMDINVYNVHFAVGLFGAPAKVHYLANRASNGIDTSGILTLGYDDFSCVLCGAKDSGSPSNALIQGTRGYIRTTGPVQESLDYEGVSEGAPFARLAEPTANRMMPELADFVRAVSENDWETAQSWLDHSLAVLAVLDQARQSAGIVFPADPVSP
jgi:predicted dehydrogenase